MKLLRILLALMLVALVVGAAYVGQATETPGLKMADAAEKFLDGLTPEQKAKATFAFDDQERTNWHFVPMQDSGRKPTRKGLPLAEMKPEQREAALAIVKAGTSTGGFTKAKTIMSLEAILHDLEKGGAMVRDPGWYFFTIFGTPGKTSRWGWRVEGHHLSLNFVIDKGKVVSATPAFFGANPATVKDGPRKGLRTVTGAEDLARQLFKSLSDDQKKTAYQEKQFPEITQAKAAPDVGEPVGLPAAQMTAGQRDTLVKLLHAYTDRMPEEIGSAELAEVRQAGIDRIRFAYAGSVEPGKPHTYRVQGPTFVVEFLNVQPDSAGNPANHIHSSWRSMHGDFGLTASRGGSNPTQDR
jgi:hypothetical protein